MQTNNNFSFKRFMLLCQQSLIINKKLIGITLIGFIGALTIVLMFRYLQCISCLKDFYNRDYAVIFLFGLLSLGIIYSSLSFPAFRSKNRSMTFLMLPSSAVEKFTFELLSRVVLFLVLMPSLFWVIVNIEASVMHYYFPHFQNYWFSFKDAYYQITDPKKTKWLVYAFVQGGLFTFIFSFAGASHFSKSPLLKTLFTFSILVGGYFLFAYLLYKGLNLREYSPVNGRILFVSSQEGFAKFLGIAITIMNLIFLTIAYFRLKEKEV